MNINQAFSRHIPNDEQQKVMDDIRRSFYELASTIITNVPAGANQTLALRHLEDALMRANKGILELQ